MKTKRYSNDKLLLLLLLLRAEKSPRTKCKIASRPRDVRVRLKRGVNGMEWRLATLGSKQRGRRKEGRKEEGQTRQGRKESFVRVVWKESGRGWVAEGKVVARHRCVSDVICGCHGDAIDWPTRRQTSRESRRHSDYCPSPRPSDCTPTSTPPLLHVSIPRAFTSPLSHATPIPVRPMAAQTRPNTLDTRPSNRVAASELSSLPFNAIAPRGTS